MLLSASIVFEELNKLHPVEIAGPVADGLRLSRPELYMDDNETFLADHLYIVTVEHLPQHPVVGKGAVLICIGSSPLLKMYRSKMCIITVKGRPDFFRVFQEVQDTYNAYDAWEHKLYENLLEEADIKKLVSDAGPIFEHAVFVLDRSFKLAASCNMAPEVRDRFQGNRDSLSQESISQYLDSSNTLLDERKPTVIELMGQKVLATNLFNEDGKYEGCLCLYSKDKQFHTGAAQLSEAFARILQLAVKSNAAIINSESTPLKAVMQSLLEELPITPSQRVVLDASNNATTYVCVFLRNLSTDSQLPQAYVCNVFCEAFANSHAFVYNRSIVGFIDIRPFVNKKTGEYVAALSEALSAFLSGMKLRAGVSNEFSNLFDIRIHYYQAESAVDIGQLISPDDQLFFFSEYALLEMVLNSLGGRPAQTYYPKGLAEIVEHDEKAGVSYLETLTVLLEENMSYSAAAKRLFIHRSTLVDRVARISRESGIDLDDPNQRLQLEILLKAAEIERLFRQ